MVAYVDDVRVHVARAFTRLLGVEPGMKTFVGVVNGSFFASFGSAVSYDNEEGVGEAMAILSKRGISMV